jgi:hypothetical protein
MKAVFNAKEKMREEIAVEMMQKVPVLASRIFSAVLSGSVKELTHKELVKDVIEKVKRLDKATFKTPVERVEITTAYPLPVADKSEMESAICHALGYEVPLVEKKDPNIAVGIVIRLGSIIVDGSLENRMRQAQRELAEGAVTGRQEQKPR